MFKDYLKRQLSNRGNVYKKLDIGRSTYYKRLNNPELITLGDFRKMMKIGELDEKKVMDWICGKER